MDWVSILLPWNLLKIKHDFMTKSYFWKIDKVSWYQIFDYLRTKNKMKEKCFPLVFFLCSIINGYLVTFCTLIYLKICNSDASINYTIWSCAFPHSAICEIDVYVWIPTLMIYCWNYNIISKYLGGRWILVNDEKYELPELSKKWIFVSAYYDIMLQ